MQAQQGGNLMGHESNVTTSVNVGDVSALLTFSKLNRPIHSTNSVLFLCKRPILIANR